LKKKKNGKMLKSGCSMDNVFLPPSERKILEGEEEKVEKRVGEKPAWGKRGNNVAGEKLRY